MALEPMSERRPTPTLDPLPQAPSERRRGPWRDGAVLVCDLAEDHPWPRRCICCGMPTDTPSVRFPLLFVPKWVLAIFVVSRTTGIILMFFTRRSASATLSICREHANQRRRGFWALGVSVFLLVTTFLGTAFWSDWMFLASVLSLVPTMLAAWQVLLIRPVGADPTQFRIAGVHPDVLAELPPFS